MKIAYVTTYDACDIKNWSGTGYFIWKSLADCGVEIEFIGSLSINPRVQWAVNLKKSFHRKITRDLYLQEHDIAVAKNYALQVSRQLSMLKGIDAVVSPGTIPVAYLTGEIPLVTFSDATSRIYFNSYKSFKKLSLYTRYNANVIDRTAYERSSASVFCSDWAAQSCIRDYKINPKKVYVVPFGANFDQSPTRGDVLQAIDERKYDLLELIFIGVEWERKGGPLLLEVVDELICQGYRFHLTILGSNPKIPKEYSSHITVLGMVSKTPEGQREIHGLIKKSHFLIVPSEAECFGIVYCEASAFGVPSIGRLVGGVSSAVRDEINGRLFSGNSQAKEIVAWIQKLFTNPALYKKIAISSRDEYENRLNWDVAGERLKDIISKSI